MILTNPTIIFRFYEVSYRFERDDWPNWEWIFQWVSGKHHCRNGYNSWRWDCKHCLCILWPVLPSPSSLLHLSYPFFLSVLSSYTQIPRTVLVLLRISPLMNARVLQMHTPLHALYHQKCSSELIRFWNHHIIIILLIITRPLSIMNFVS